MTCNVCFKFGVSLSLHSMSAWYIAACWLHALRRDNAHTHTYHNKNCPIISLWLMDTSIIRMAPSYWRLNLVLSQPLCITYECSFIVRLVCNNSYTLTDLLPVAFLCSFPPIFVLHMWHSLSIHGFPHCKHRQIIIVIWILTAAILIIHIIINEYN